MGKKVITAGGRLDVEDGGAAGCNECVDQFRSWLGEARGCRVLMAIARHSIAVAVPLSDTHDHLGMAGTVHCKHGTVSKHVSAWASLHPMLAVGLAMHHLIDVQHTCMGTHALRHKCPLCHSV